MVDRILTVALGERAYDIVIGPGLLDGLGERLAPLLPGKQIGLVSNEIVAPLYLDRVTETLQKAGFQVTPVILKDGEDHKDWSNLSTLFDTLIQARFERSATIVALGGGVVGDMSGFAAAALLRGIAFVQVPTTLLSQVDASVGGKTGINHPLGKNLIGAFYQPRTVVIDTETLKTLPKRDFCSGLAEVIKYGIIWDAPFFDYLETKMEAILRLERDPLIHILHTCCAIKADVVAQDEREAGTRALLNLGHTFGHAIETLAGYGTLLHGEGVAIGMVMAAELACRRGLCDRSTVVRIQRLLEKAQLPIVAPSHLSPENFLAVMGRDKKVSHGQIRLILNGPIGQARIHADLPQAQIVEAILAHSAG